MLVGCVFIQVMFDAIATRASFDQGGADVISFFYQHLGRSRAYQIVMGMMYGLVVVGATAKVGFYPGMTNIAVVVLLLFPLIRIPVLLGSARELGESQINPMSLEDQTELALSLFYEHLVLLAVLFVALCLQIVSLANDGIARLEHNTAGYKLHIRKMENFIRAKIPPPGNPSSNNTAPTNTAPNNSSLNNTSPNHTKPKGD